MLLSKPHIIFFRAATTEVMAGEEVLLEWEVENARKLTLDGNEVQLKGNLQLAVDHNRKIELVATNWPAKDTREMEIKLKKPVIDDYRVDDPAIREGQPVTVTMELRHTMSWELVMEYPGAKRSKVAEGLVAETGGFHLSVPVTVSSPGKLQLIARNGAQVTTGEWIRLYPPALYLEIHTDQTIVTQGSILRVSWKVEHASRLTLDPGNFDVTGLPHYDLPVNDDKDVTIALTAYGDFEQKTTSFKLIYVARINYITVTNNGNYREPKYYLNWSATCLQDLRLSPGDVIVKENEWHYEIPGSAVPVDYTLTGKTFNGIAISKRVTLNPCSTHLFRLEKTEVIIGMMATVRWQGENIRHIQLYLAGSPAVIEIPPAESSYSFQALHERNKVTLVTWGDTNLVILERPLQAFKGPEIRLLQVPSLTLHLRVDLARVSFNKPRFSQALGFAIKKRTVSEQWSFYKHLKNPGVAAKIRTDKLPPKTALGSTVATSSTRLPKWTSLLKKIRTAMAEYRRANNNNTKTTGNAN